LLESNGRFALIDSGEGDENPRRKMPYNGYSQRVIDYLKKAAGDKDGKVNLEFILGTHYHYDHSGSFHKIINDSDISIKTAYFKVYDPSMGKKLEAVDWGLQDVYNTIIADVKKEGIELVQDIPSRLSFGDFELELFNTVNYPDLKGRGDNSESIGIKVIKGNKSAFLAADITKGSGLEDKLKDSIGHCDLLKIGHHGYFGSSSMSFLDRLTPELAIVTNLQGKVYPNVKWNLTMHAKIPFYGTYDYNGIIASFTDSNEIILTDNIHDKGE
jgi:beta-lactamase superfamily II metal-dependent hydrolase